MGSVNGRVALITGAANGIGAEVARRLHDKGAKLILTDLDESLLEEVAARLGGVEVGSAHMLWIDTPLDRESKSLPAFKGIEGRKRQVNCPGRVGLMRRIKPLMSTRIGELTTVKSVPELLPQMDAETAAQGRSMSARIDSLENH